MDRCGNTRVATDKNRKFKIWGIGDTLARGAVAVKKSCAFFAIDAETGKTVWQFQTGSGINAQPIMFTHNGKRYITVLCGIGGFYWNAARESLKNVPQGGFVWTFALAQ